VAGSATKERPRTSARAGRPERNGDEATAGSYAREAIAQWATAARLGAASTLPTVRETAVGRGRRAAGAIADWALSRAGPAGKLASKLSLGSRSIAKGSSDDGAMGDGGNDVQTEVTIPIQEAITVAAPVALAYRLATAVEDFPNFLEHVVEARRKTDREVEFAISLRGVRRRLSIEIFDSREDERVDWRSTDGIEHAGTVSFHELAPRLTRIELSIDLEPRGLLQRLSRATHLSDHAVANELRRFKAYAELYEGDDDDEFEPDEEAESEPEEPAE
jgi:uncharacterized membrane protein